MNKLSSWLDTITDGAGKVAGLFQPKQTAPAAAAPAAEKSNTIYWIIGGAVAVVLVLLLVMRGK